MVGSALKIQMHAMFLDTRFNGVTTVLDTVYQHFVEVAMKVYRYGRCMGAAQLPSSDLLIRKLALMPRFIPGNPWNVPISCAEH